eukprot:scaffold50864_cov18-Tisochrysis_lutea.AAC.1
MQLSSLSKTQSIGASRQTTTPSCSCTSAPVPLPKHRMPSLPARRISFPKLPSVASAAAPAHVQPETDVIGMPQFLGNLKFNQDGLVAVIVQVSFPIEEEMRSLSMRHWLN